MTTTTQNEVGVVIKILQECEGQEIKMETILGVMLEGKLVKAENNMNCLMSTVTMTKKDGTKTEKDNVCIRGTHVKMVFLPKAAEGLCNFKVKESRPLTSSTGRGKRDILRAQAEARFSRRHGHSHHQQPRRSSSLGSREHHGHREHHGYREHHEHRRHHEHRQHHGHREHHGDRHCHSSPPHQRYWDP